jgi:hypothetical protein
MILLTILILILIVLAVASIQLAFSGSLQGREYLGWILLIIFGVVAYESVAIWMSRHPGPISKLATGIVGALLFATQAPLLVELISQAVLPDRSKGLRLLKVHTEAEKK